MKNRSALIRLFCVHLWLRDAAVIVINNDIKPAEIEFDVSPAGLKNGASFTEALNVSRDAVVRDGKLRVSLPKRSAAIFVRK